MSKPTTFDNGFRVARLLRHRWFLEELQAAGWQNGENIIGAVPETPLSEIRAAMRHYEQGKRFFVVLLSINDHHAITGVIAVIPMQAPAEISLMISGMWGPAENLPLEGENGMD